MASIHSSSSSAIIFPSTSSQARTTPARHHVLLSLRAFKIVVYAFHAVFVWIVLVFQYKHARVTASIAVNSDITVADSPGRDDEREEERAKVSAAPVKSRVYVLDAQERRALAENVRLLHMPDLSGSCWTTRPFVNSRGQKLFAQSWIPAPNGNMKGLVILLHGLNEHSGRYIHFARQLNFKGYGVFAMDWIGHGGSDGLHGYVASLDHVVSDTKVFLQGVAAENPGVPCFLFGHSTGGAIALKASSHSSVEMILQGVILTSPALRVKPAHPLVTVVAPVFSVLMPTVQFKGANKRGIPVSRDPAALVTKYTDPLVYTGPIRIRTGSEILKITAYLQRNLKKFTVPFFVLHGTADRVTDPYASQDLYNNAASQHKQIKLYDGYLHDLLFEPEKDEIIDDIIRWMDDRIKS